MMQKLTAQQRIENLQDSMADDIMNMTDDEILAEMIEDGYDPEAEAEKVKAIIETVINRADRSTGQPQRHPKIFLMGVDITLSIVLQLVIVNTTVRARKCNVDILKKLG